MEPDSLELYQLLHELFYYKDGELIRKVTRCHNAKKGDVVGCIGVNGYKVVNIDGVVYLLHRLIYLYHYKYLPDIVDHVDQDKLNNKIENLREASPRLNAHNSTTIHSSTGFRGVSFNKRKEKYVAKIRDNYCYLHLGYFDTAEEASKAYQNKKKEIMEKLYEQTERY